MAWSAVIARRVPIPRWASVLLGALSLACGGERDLHLERVEPGFVHWRVPDRISVYGVFSPVVALDLGGSQEPVLRETFDVVINNERATDVQFKGPDRLEFGVPPDLDPSSYDLRVIDPEGSWATLRGAIEVRVSPPKKIVFTTPIRTLLDDEWSDGIRIELRDENDLPSLARERMVIQVVSDSQQGRGQLSINRGESAQQILRMIFEPGTVGRNIYYQDPMVGEHLLTASADGLEPANQMVIVESRDPVPVTLARHPVGTAAP